MTLIRDWDDNNGKTVRDAIAVVHKFEGDKAKMMFELDHEFAINLVKEAVKTKGKCRVRISLVDDEGNATPVDARIDTFDPTTKTHLIQQQKHN